MTTPHPAQPDTSYSPFISSLQLEPKVFLNFSLCVSQSVSHSDWLHHSWVQSALTQPTLKLF
ncbi:hypothetical protein E2C01_011120 [Portunus trituberculatus]|uniref:Uncharacterized protein n=1 Tax=Portunus trituberculatus TaxID=210409 RepID=A0A5B7DA96_PORTR|nr:hypothetical protein [Portunus trituberculatus]